MTGIEPATNGANGVSSLCALPLSYTAYHVLYIALYHRPSYARQPHPAFALQHYPRRQNRLTHYWCLLSGYCKIVLSIHHYYRGSFGLLSSVPLFPRTYTTTYPRAFAHRPTRERMDSELTSFLPAVLTGWIPSLSTPCFLRSLSLPFRVDHSRYG